MDTSLDVHREMIRLLRQKTPEQRLKMALDLTDLGAQIHRLALKRIAEGRTANLSANES